MSDPSADTDQAASASFQVQSPHEAFHEYTESEIVRMRETDPLFDEDFYREAQQLVAGRLIAAQAQAQERIEAERRALAGGGVADEGDAGAAS